MLNISRICRANAQILSAQFLEMLKELMLSKSNQIYSSNKK